MVEVPEYFQKKLLDKEEVVLFVRPFGIVYTVWFLVSGVLLFSSLYYSFYMLRFGFFGIALFFIIFLIGLFSFIKTVIVWRFTAVVVTNRRIIDYDQHGLFVRQLSEAPFINVQDISLSQRGVLALLLNYGTIKIQTASANNVLELAYIRQPRQVQEILVELKNQSAQIVNEKIEENWQQDPKLQSFFSVLEKKKQELGATKVKEALDEWLKEDK
ncbi:MAG: PH domain-containing protein [Candidatus Margulisiibacteriota bacterium]|jgi:membrane protein YdbS with pleckstrin-like domain